MNKDISIIIPVYKAKDTIGYAINSILKQKFKYLKPKIEIIISIDDQNKWSSGTVAMKKKLKKHFISKNCQFKDLSAREVEHLNTRSSIPYRDPTGKGRSKEIIATRELEQSKSQLINTSSWRKRWNTAQ